jgi:hypothetical protein
MKLQALALATGLMMTGGAYAAVNNLALTDNLYLGAFGAPIVYADGFAVATAGTINHALTFDITTPLYAGAGVSDIPFSFVLGSFTLTVTNITGLSASIYDSGNNLYATFIQNGDPDHLILPANSYFATDSYTLKIGGTSTGINGGLYTVAAVTAVPEPETWAMLLVGLSLVGLGLRQKA